MATQIAVNFSPATQHQVDAEIQFLTPLVRRHHVHHGQDVCCGSAIVTPALAANWDAYLWGRLG